MKRLLCLPLVAALVLGGSVASVLAAAPAQRYVVPVTAVATEISCPADDYQLVSGELVLILRQDLNPAGVMTVVSTTVLHDVTAMGSDGSLYAIRGASHDGAMFSPRGDGVEGLPTTATFTETLQIIPVGGGGSVGSVSLAHHLTNQANQWLLNEFDFGACTENSNPAE